MAQIIYKLLAGGLMIVATACTGCNDTQVIYPQRKNIIEAVYASGKIIPANEFSLAVLCTGTIVKKLVQDGDTVQKGQLLYVVSSQGAGERYDAAVKRYDVASANISDKSPLLKDLKLSMENAAMKCSEDSSTYYRYKNLWAQDIGTKSNLERVYVNYQVSLNQQKIAEQKYYSALNELKVSQSNARSQLAEAGKYLQEYFVRSDRDGVVYQTFKDAGEAVHTNELVALIGESNSQVIRMAVDQQDIGKIRNGQRVLLQADVTGKTIYEAEVTKIYPVMNEQDQTFRVDAVFIRRPAFRFIHSSIEANIIIQRKDNALVLPRNVLLGNDTVWINANRSRKKRGIQTGISTLEYVEITAGLDEKTPVLVLKNDVQ